MIAKFENKILDNLDNFKCWLEPIEEIYYGEPRGLNHCISLIPNDLRVKNSGWSPSYDKNIDIRQLKKHDLYNFREPDNEELGRYCIKSIKRIYLADDYVVSFKEVNKDIEIGNGQKDFPEKFLYYIQCSVDIEKSNKGKLKIMDLNVKHNHEFSNWFYDIIGLNAYVLASQDTDKSYQFTQALARILYDSFPNLAGIYYLSSEESLVDDLHKSYANCIVLYHSRFKKTGYKIKISKNIAIEIGVRRMLRKNFHQKSSEIL